MVCGVPEMMIHATGRWVPGLDLVEIDSMVLPAPSFLYGEYNANVYYHREVILIWTNGKRNCS